MLDCSELIVAPSGGIFRPEFEARMNVLRKKVKTNNVFAIFGGGGGLTKVFEDDVLFEI